MICKKVYSNENAYLRKFKVKYIHLAKFKINMIFSPKD